MSSKLWDRFFKLVIKQSDDVKSPKVRDQYGKLAGLVGIVSNMFLCLMKVLVGFLSGSIAIIADGINNLADGGSAVITWLGFKLASMPEDEKHPFGHARYEYLSGLLVSFIIILVGFELVKSSFDKILYPAPISFSWTVVLVLLLAILVKIWQAIFNFQIGKKIDSVALIATGADSRNDVIATTAVLASLLLSHFCHIQLDGYMGLAVALFIIWSGISLVRETISPLLGEGPDSALVEQIEDIVLSYDGILGIHDLVVHNYGPEKRFASIHIEVDAAVDVLVSHDLVDSIEHRLRRELGVHITAHMDPISLDNPNREPVTSILEEVIQTIPGVISFHDLRFVNGPTHTNVIFDVVISDACTLTEQELQEQLHCSLTAYDPTYFVVIEVDRNYVTLSGKKDN